jgi:hypothetical protein
MRLDCAARGQEGLASGPSNELRNLAIVVFEAFDRSPTTKGFIMKKLIHTALFTTAAGALTFGAAASLDVRAENLGAGAIGVASCDADGVDVAWGFVENEPELVGFLYIRDVAPECFTQTVNVSVGSAQSAVLATGTAVIDAQNVADATVLVDLSSDVQASQIHEVSVTITGAPTPPPAP